MFRDSLLWDRKNIVKGLKRWRTAKVSVGGGFDSHKSSVLFTIIPACIINVYFDQLLIVKQRKNVSIGGDQRREYTQGNKRRTTTIPSLQFHGISGNFIGSLLKFIMEVFDKSIYFALLCFFCRQLSGHSHICCFFFMHFCSLSLQDLVMATDAKEVFFYQGSMV